MERMTKETRVVNPEKAPESYMTDIGQNGIFVHPKGDSTSGWRISDAIELLKSGVSWFKLWLDSNVMKLRIGRADSSHVTLDGNGAYTFKDATHFTHQASDGFHVYSGDADNDVAHLGANLRIGKANKNRALIGESSFEMANTRGTRYFQLREDPDVTATVAASVYGSTVPTDIVPGSTFYAIINHGYNEENVSKISFTQGTGESKTIFVDAPSNLVVTYYPSTGDVTTACSAQGYQHRVVGIEYTTSTLLVYAAFGSVANLASRGNFTFSCGEGLAASSDKQTVTGKFNVEDVNNTYAILVGNGTSDNARSNALALKWDGTLELAKALPIASGGTGRTTALAYGSLTNQSSSLSLSTSAQKVPLSTFAGSGCSASSNGIKVSQAGVYMVCGSVCLYNGFTAGDLVHVTIRVNSNDKCYARIRPVNGGSYETVQAGPAILELAANDTVYLFAYNQDGARGSLAGLAGVGLVIRQIG